MKKTGTTLLRIVLTLGILGVIVIGFQKKLGDQQDILQQLKLHFQNIRYGWFFLATVMMMIGTLMGTFRFTLLTRSHGINIAYPVLLKNLYIGYLFNHLLMGSTGGDIVRSYYLTKVTSKKTEIVTILLLDRFIGVSVLLTIGSLALISNLSDPRFQDIFKGVILLMGLLGLFALLCSSSKVMQRFSFLGRFLGPSKIKDIGKKAFLILNETKKHKKTLLAAAACTLLFQSLAILSAWTAAHSIATIAPIPLKQFFLFIPIIFTIMAIPISLGGLGVGEVAYATLFLMVGVPEVAAIAISLLNRVILVILGMIGGCIYLLPSTLRYEGEA